MFLAHLASPMLAPTSVGKQVFHVCASLAQFSACSEKLFKRIFQGCCLLFNYQGSSLLPSQRQLIYIITSSICLSTTFFIFLILCYPQCSHSSGCPDDECYNITENWNCQQCFCFLFYFRQFAQFLCFLTFSCIIFTIFFHFILNIAK